MKELTAVPCCFDNSGDNRQPHMPVIAFTAKFISAGSDSFKKAARLERLCHKAVRAKLQRFSHNLLRA